MDIRRIVLYMALALVGLSLWNAWQADFPSTAESKVADTSLNEPIVSISQTDSKTETPLISDPISAQGIKKPSQVIEVKTDVLNVTIDLVQGNIVSSQLLNYPASVDDKNKPFVLLQNDANERYVANSELLVNQNQVIRPESLIYSSEKKYYDLDGEHTLHVVLNAKNEQGIDVIKEFVFKRNSYLIAVNYTIANTASMVWKGYLNTQLVRSSPKEDKSSVFHVGSFTGASYSEPGKHRYQKVNFSDMHKSNLDIDSNGGWIAMQQHYFLSAWIPNLTTAPTKFYTRADKQNYTIGAVSQAIILQPQQHQSIGAQLYIGPEITSTLKDIAPSLDLTVDYGILWFVSSLLFSLMKAIYNVVGNWGWSIVLVTFLIKLAFYRLSATSYKSMAGMRKLQPKLQLLKERYGDDKAKISQETMALYRQEKVNPLGGCLPIVIQIPVFIALYWVLLESVELRQAPFILWIKDLASADPYHVLPVIMGITMLIQQKLNPAPPDPMQAKVMMFLPILFTGLFWSFPAGLVLYWIVNNTLSIIQQWYITRKYADDMPAKKLVATSK